MNKEDLLTYKIQYISRMLKRHVDQQTLKFGLTTEQGRTIIHLYLHKNEVIHLTDLMKTFNIRKSSLSSLINNLEKNGFVVRTVENGDQRQKRIELTKLGEERVQMLLDVFEYQEAKVREKLTKEESLELDNLLDKVMDSLNGIE